MGANGDAGLLVIGPAPVGGVRHSGRTFGDCDADVARYGGRDHNGQRPSTPRSALDSHLLCTEQLSVAR